MSKPKSKSIRSRATRWWEKRFGSPSSTAPPSQPSTPNTPSISLSPDPGPSETRSHAPELPLSSPALGVTQPPSPALSHSALSLPVPASRTPSLRIPAALQDLPSSGNEGSSWSGLRSALQTLHTNSALFPPLQSVVGELLSGVELFEESTENQKECEVLVLELKMTSETLGRHWQGSNTVPNTESIAAIVQLIQEQVDLIAKEQNDNLGRRLMKAERLTLVLSTCNRLIQVLCRQVQRNQLKELNPAKLADYDSSLAMDINRRACTENTRTGVLSDIRAWIANPSAPNVCWMNGMAGTGKTTIAYTLAQELKKNKQLAASFFCTRTTAECRDVSRIVSTIAYQLACHSAPFLQSLCQALRSDLAASTRSIQNQFEQLIKQPLLEVKEKIPSGLVVIIDALDECTVSNGVKLVLDILLREAPNLPLKIFVTSRPEPSIRGKIQEQSENLRSVYELHAVKASDVQADIELYLHEQLPSVELPQLKLLAGQSGGLFIYAATAARYIRAGNIEERLARILSVKFVSKKAHEEIDKLYTTILSAAFNPDVLEEDEAERMRLVLRTAVCAREPMSAYALATLTRIDGSKKVLEALEPLRSVIYVSADCNVVSTLHASFPDYLFNESRSSTFYCNQEQHDGLIARRCFEIMKEQLRFNICGLESSYVLDRDVPSLDRRVTETITPTLAYACRYWADHIQETSPSDELGALLDNFLLERLLFWMEVMNLKHWTGLSVRVMLAAKLWVMAQNVHSSLLQAVEDARNFVASFAANAVAESTPHIYVSALPFCHQSSVVYKHHWNKMCRMIKPEGPGMRTRYPTVIASWMVDSRVRSVAYSPDGTRIAAGRNDGSIVVKDAHDGALIYPPFEGHASSVMSVAFSPDGTRIVSGSSDKTIRMWNAQDGNLIGAPFEGHTELVTSVAFSPDGTRIVSGSYDNTIRMWNAQDGNLIGAPLEGHTSWVGSVAFSPDGTRIVSGSDDNTIRMWNAHDGSLMGAALKGHTSSVNSVAFSPDGTRIVSGSYDNTIRMWNAQDGIQIGAPLEGHANWVKSVAFSPDGTRIVSGSDDHTIRMWNAQDGSSIGAPLEGHTSSVNSVAFSPDSTRIVSGSNDKTIRMWNAQDGSQIGAPLEGHTSSVLSVAFSPDGTRIVSGSHDKTIRVWNAQDGSSIGAPLEGHTGLVTSVAFSPDGTRIVSGSWDNTIRMWNAQDGSPIGAPLEGHTRWVGSVAFSPDGTRIVSGSWDNSIRMWNAQDGSPIGAPLEGHTSWVNSVAFSPDGTRIVSGSRDNTIRMWNAQDGSVIGAPLEGHTNSVKSVAFSPDGTRIVSGSSDYTIRMWNAQDGSQIGAPLEGRTSSVNSVAFSPDGTRIVSGSDDNTIRMWNAQDGSPIGAPLKGHTNSVTSVAFSPDGTLVAAASGGTVSILAPHSQTSSLHTWYLREDGWVIGPDARLLCWVPQDLAPYLPNPHNLWAIGPNGAISVNWRNALDGICWLDDIPS